MNVILESKGLCKTYSSNDAIQRPILKNINLSIEQGEFVCLMGPSGSGKSTLLYSLSGMDGITEGSVVFYGQELSLLTEQQLAKLRLHKMGFIFQQIHLLKNLSLFDNIICSAYLAKKDTHKHINQRAQTLMQEMGIADLSNNDITQASGGQLQRAAICRALINEPLIIFGDEPTGALDSKTAHEVMHIFNSINQSGTTILLATHDMKVASKSDRVIYIVDGTIVSEHRLGPLRENNDVAEREKCLAAWLMNLGF